MKRIADRPSLPFILRKQPAVGSRGMVVTNHPLASAAGVEMLLSGGNAFDATVAALFALTVVEPMMVGPLGGGIIHFRTPDGRHEVIDGLSTAPAAATPDMFRPLGAGLLPNDRDTEGQQNVIGGAAVAVPGALAAWVELHKGRGRMSLSDLVQPAIRLATRGFAVTPYLADCVSDSIAMLAGDPGLSNLFLPAGTPIRAGERLRQPELATTLTELAAKGAATLHGGPLGDLVVAGVAARGGILSAQDLTSYRLIVREPIRATYRGFDIYGPPPPASAGIHIAQMLNVIEGFDIGAMGYGSPEAAHLLAEALKIAFADRAATADPDFVSVPVETITSKAYAAKLREEIDQMRARDWSKPGAAIRESADTTHLTVADADGAVVAATQTINGLFGAGLMVPGTGLLANNYMYNFDPHPGRAQSIAPGKRCFTSMAPMMIVKDGSIRHALGLPGGLRIFPSAFQAIVNLIDFGMSAQEAVEAPRLWTEGGRLELEPDYPAATEAALAKRGHETIRNPRIAGGMNAISFAEDGMMTGASCWRADGTPVGLSGGLAAAGIRFSL